jgi:hypothetical protein
MLRYESQWFDSVCRLLLLRVFWRVFVKTELNKIAYFQMVIGSVRYRPGHQKLLFLVARMSVSRRGEASVSP